MKHPKRLSQSLVCVQKIQNLYISHKTIEKITLYIGCKKSPFAEGYGWTCSSLVDPLALLTAMLSI